MAIVAAIATSLFKSPERHCCSLLRKSKSDAEMGLRDLVTKKDLIISSLISNHRLRQARYSNARHATTVFSKLSILTAGSRNSFSRYDYDSSKKNLQFFFLELPRLQKIWESLETNLERWCYLFRNLNSFVETPPDQAGFEDLFSIAQTGELNENGISKYVTSMVTEYDRKVIGEYFFREGSV